MEAKVYTEIRALFTEYLTEKKLRKTEERYAIFKEICAFPGHFDMCMLSDRLEQDNFHVSKATLYNTLDVLVDAGLVVLAAFVSPYRSDRDAIRALLPDGEFVEVFVDTPLAECEQRDPKGLYKKARAGEIKNFTGISDPYEAPEQPEVHIHNHARSVSDVVAELLAQLQARGLLAE